MTENNEFHSNSIGTLYSKLSKLRITEKRCTALWTNWVSPPSNGGQHPLFKHLARGAITDHSCSLLYQHYNHMLKSWPAKRYTSNAVLYTIYGIANPWAVHYTRHVTDLFQPFQDWTIWYNHQRKAPPKLCNDFILWNVDLLSIAPYHITMPHTTNFMT